MSNRKRVSVMVIAYIPMIIGAVVLGLKGGLIMGIVYGVLSFWFGHSCHHHL